VSHHTVVELLSAPAAGSRLGGAANYNGMVRRRMRTSPPTRTRSTRQMYTSRLEQAGIRIAWNGHDRALDHVFVEQPWRWGRWKRFISRNIIQLPKR
jgi:hypothetical protein